MFRSRSAFSLAATVALLAVVAPSQPFDRFSAIATASATFEVPASVPDATSLKVSSGSDAMGLISADKTIKNAANDAAKAPQSLWQRVQDGVNQDGKTAGDLKDKASDVADDLKDLGK